MINQQKKRLLAVLVAITALVMGHGKYSDVKDRVEPKKKDSTDERVIQNQQKEEREEARKVRFIGCNNMF
ncbi:MAG: hypothetical protein WBK67_04300 [Minisyncoccales bacterium]